MRRVNKCAGKAKFCKKSGALATAKKWYLANGSVFGIYECPVCLDFHLTSKYTNLQEYYNKWVVEIQPKKLTVKMSPEQKLKRKVYIQYLEFLNIEKKVLNKLSNTLKSNKPIKKPKTTLIGTLPLARQKEILATLDNSKFSPPNTFLSRILGIIKM